MLYVDSSEVDRKDISGKTFSGNTATVHQFGQVGDGTTERHWDGLIDDVRIYDYALSSEEIGWLAGNSEVHVPLPAEAAAIDESLHGDGKINFKDFAVLAENWFNAGQCWQRLTVNVEPNIADINTVTPGAGEHIYCQGTTVDLCATSLTKCPDVYRFDHWEGVVADANSFFTTVVMNEDRTVTAVFVGERLQGDIDGSCVVDFADLLVLSEQWLEKVACTESNCADLDGDNNVNMSDFAILAGDWLKMTIQEQRKQTAKRERQIVFHSDGMPMDEETKDALYDTFGVYLEGDKISLFNSIPGTQTSACTYSLMHQFNVARLYRTEVAQEWPVGVIETLYGDGPDGLDGYIDFCRQNDYEAFWAMRTNDTHDASGSEHGLMRWNSNPWKQTHLQLLVGLRDNPPPNGGWSAVDFTHP